MFIGVQKIFHIKQVVISIVFLLVHCRNGL